MHCLHHPLNNLRYCPWSWKNSWEDKSSCSAHVFLVLLEWIVFPPFWSFCISSRCKNPKKKKKKKGSLPVGTSNLILVHHFCILGSVFSSKTTLWGLFSFLFVYHAHVIRLTDFLKESKHIFVSQFLTLSYFNFICSV